MEFDIGKCDMLVIKTSKLYMTEEVVIRPLEEIKTYKYLEILEADTIKQVEITDKIEESVKKK